MSKFIPKEKLGKKARKELAKQTRRVWNCDPVSRIVESKKVYKRNGKENRRWLREADGGHFFMGKAFIDGQFLI